MQTDVSFRLKNAVKRASSIRENSWKDAEGLSLGHYSTSLHRACSIAAKEEGFDVEMAEVIFLLLFNSWNEALGWADCVTKR